MFVSSGWLVISGAAFGVMLQQFYCYYYLYHYGYLLHTLTKRKTAGDETQKWQCATRSIIGWH
jgi:hypothetical protein